MDKYRRKRRRSWSNRSSTIFPIIPSQPSIYRRREGVVGVLTVAQRGWGKSEFVLAWGTLAMFCWHWRTTTEPITRLHNPNELCSHHFSLRSVHTRNHHPVHARVVEKWIKNLAFRYSCHGRYFYYNNALYMRLLNWLLIFFSIIATSVILSKWFLIKKQRVKESIQYFY